MIDSRKRRRLWMAVGVLGATGVLVYLVSARIIPFGRRVPSFARDIEKIEWDWDQARMAAANAVRAAKTPAEKERARTELAAKEQSFVARCEEVAARNPASRNGLEAEYVLASRVPETKEGKQAAETLVADAASVDLGVLDQALYGLTERHPPQRLAAIILERVKKAPNHPRAPRLVASIVCGIATLGEQGQVPPPAFAEAADLIVERYADSPEIVNFCEQLGFVDTPIWSAPFEKHLRTILAKNQHRAVRAAAAFALASVVQQSGESRQLEAQSLFEDFTKEFDGRTDYYYANIEKRLNDSAKTQLVELDQRRLGKQSPDIAGTDLDGRAMQLSQFRGKVVLLSFWATWCGPCMKMLPEERELSERLKNRPFVIVGINGDDDIDAAQRAAADQKLTWKSFRNRKSPREKSISSEWNADFPTFYLIDKRGVIKKRWAGSLPSGVLASAIDQLLGAPPQTKTVP